jgi:hypothetical protein
MLPLNVATVSTVIPSAILIMKTTDQRTLIHPQLSQQPSGI